MENTGELCFINQKVKLCPKFLVRPPGTVVPGGLMFYCCFSLFSFLFFFFFQLAITELPRLITLKLRQMIGSVYSFITHVPKLEGPFEPKKVGLKTCKIHVTLLRAEFKPP